MQVELEAGAQPPPLVRPTPACAGRTTSPRCTRNPPASYTRVCRSTPTERVQLRLCVVHLCTRTCRQDGLKRALALISTSCTRACGSDDYDAVILTQNAVVHLPVRVGFRQGAERSPTRRPTPAITGQTCPGTTKGGPPPTNTRLCGSDNQAGRPRRHGARRTPARTGRTGSGARRPRRPPPYTRVCGSDVGERDGQGPGGAVHPRVRVGPFATCGV